MTPEVFAQAIASIAQNYGLRLDARSVWLRMDEFKKVEELKGGKCNEATGWYGLKGACKRGKKGEGDARNKESKVDIANRIRKRKMSRTANSNITDPGIAQYKVVRELGKGDFGAAVLTDRGTVIKIANGSRPRKPEEAKAEFEALKQFSKLGIGPKAIGIDGTTIEMGLITGQTIRTLKDSGISNGQHQKNQMMAAQSLLKLHRSGWSHNDSHLHNLVIDDKGQAKLLDAGAASKVGGMTWDGTGYHDIKSALRGHPSLALLSKAMEPHELAYRMAHTQAFQKGDKSRIDTDLSQARINLHNEYLKLSPQFIK